ncbi:MAG: DUF3667 domain-containing protein [Pyrinomonadaceae bacterium]|nr:DUF3667 domain-containing protein [Pyrinomonadaceae bacterium]
MNETINKNRAPTSELQPEVSSRICCNCDEPLIGEYCYVCGQPSVVERYTPKNLFFEIYNNARKIDISKTFATSIELARRPGEFVHAYLAGQRVGYINPVKFYFYAMIANALIREMLQIATADPIFASPLTGNTAFQIFGLLATVFWGVLWKLFYRGTELNWVEFAVCAIYFEAQTDIFTVTLLVFVAVFREYTQFAYSAFVLADLLVTTAYGIYFARRVFRESWPMTIVKQSALLILFAALLAFVVSDQ